MPNWAIALIIGGLIGLFLARWVARDSIQSKPIQSGGAAKFFHYLACGMLVAGAPSALTATILYNQLHFFPRLLRGVAVGFTDVGLAALCLIVFAVFESRVERVR